MVFWIIIPILFSSISFIGSWAVYGLALANKHVCPLNNWEYRNSCQNTSNTSELCCTDANIPMISTCGTNEPENSLFTATLNAGSFLFLLLCIFHHAHILDRNSSYAIVSRVALFFGCVTAFGAFVAGNCNPGSVRLLHYMGAAVSFVSLCFYALIVTFLTWRCYISGLEHILAPIRMISTVIQSFSTILYIVFFLQTEHTYLHLAAIFEWILGTNLQFFILTYITEFSFFSTPMLALLIKTKDEEKSLILS
ncbi:transmembrane protein 150A [Amia ocellicauda]|uniref:transmembrane protein 150A n=1 Tax=Amia ocellicauda TaxID=2972642 RepID=UPI003463F37F